LFNKCNTDYGDNTKDDELHIKSLNALTHRCFFKYTQAADITVKAQTFHSMLLYTESDSLGKEAGHPETGKNKGTGGKKRLETTSTILISNTFISADTKTINFLGYITQYLSSQRK